MMFSFTNIVYLIGDNYSGALLKELEDLSPAHYLFTTYQDSNLALVAQIEKIVLVSESMKEIEKHLKIADLLVVIGDTQEEKTIEHYFSLIPSDCYTVLFTAQKCQFNLEFSDIFIGEIEPSLKHFIDKITN